MQRPLVLQVQIILILLTALSFWFVDQISKNQESVLSAMDEHRMSLEEDLFNGLDATISSAKN